jgi:hypothetical protein
MESEITEENSGTNCLQCERYKKLGDICVIEHGKKFLWEYCKDFEAEVVLPDYKELMSSVRKDLAAERQKARDKKKREKSRRKKELLQAKESRLPSLEKRNHYRENVQVTVGKEKRQNLKETQASGRESKIRHQNEMPVAIPTRARVLPQRGSRAKSARKASKSNDTA